MSLSRIQYVISKIYLQLRTKLIYSLLFGKIGKKCVLHKPLRLLNPRNIRLGDNVKIYKQARIEAVEKWGNLKFKPRIEIGSRVSFEQRLHLTCGKLVEIGNDCVFSADVMITDIDHSYEEINMNVLKQRIDLKETIIGDFCFIGMGSKIMAGTKLGKNCIVGCNAVVKGQFPDYSVIVGLPAKVIKRFDFTLNKWRRVDEKGDFK